MEVILIIFQLSFAAIKLGLTFCETITPLINDEKHYLTMNNYCLNKFGKKTYRIALNGNFSCPNRDGTISHNGCLFCSSSGSGDFAVGIKGGNEPAGNKIEYLPLHIREVLRLHSGRDYGVVVCYF